MPRSKGGELLEACEGCYTRKLSCQMGGRGRRNQKIMEKSGAKKLRDSSKSEEEGMAEELQCNEGQTSKACQTCGQTETSQPGSQGAGDQSQDDQQAGWSRNQEMA